MQHLSCTEHTHSRSDAAVEFGAVKFGRRHRSFQLGAGVALVGSVVSQPGSGVEFAGSGSRSEVSMVVEWSYQAGDGVACQSCWYGVGTGPM